MERTSGRNAQILLQRNGDVPVDISGLAPDGRGRANTWAFAPTPTIVDTGGYGQDYQEPVPIGQSESTLKLTLWWSSVAGEPPAIIAQMHREQHEGGTCAVPPVYTVDMYPAGQCNGTVWRLSNAVVGVRSWQTPPDGIITMDVEIVGFQAIQGSAEQLDTLTIVTLKTGEDLECSDDGTNQAVILSAIQSYFAGLLPGDAYSQSDLDAAIANAGVVTSSTTSVTSGSITQSGSTLFVLASTSVQQAVPVDVNIDIVWQSGYTFSAVQTNVVTAIQDYLNGLALGSDATRTGIIAAAEGVAGVESVTLLSPAADVSIAVCQQAEAGNVIVNDGGYSGATEVPVDVHVVYSGTFRDETEGTPYTFLQWATCAENATIAYFNGLAVGGDVVPTAIDSAISASCDHMLDTPSLVVVSTPATTVSIASGEQAVLGVFSTGEGT